MLVRANGGAHIRLFFLKGEIEPKIRDLFSRLGIAPVLATGIADHHVLIYPVANSTDNIVQIATELLANCFAVQPADSVYISEKIKQSAAEG